MKKVTFVLFVLLICFLTISCGKTGRTTTTAAGQKEPSPIPSASLSDEESESIPVTPTSEPHIHVFQNGLCSCGMKTEEVLSGKSAIFLGDSIVMAQERDELHHWWGYAGRINADYGLKRYKNVSVDGASISDCWAPNTVVRQVKDNKKGPNYHFVVLEGGTNDAWTSTAVGKISDIAPADVTADTFKNARNTFCGGLEDTLYHATAAFEGSTFLYVITPRMNRTEGSLPQMQRYVDATVEICEKWGIPCLNLYNMDSFYGEDMNAYFATYLIDGVHPNSAGYDKLAPYIADAMATEYCKSK